MFVYWFTPIWPEYLAEFFVSRMEIDITVLCIKMEDASTFTTAITPKHIIADLDIHMSFPICTEWTPAMQLSPGISYDFDTKKINHLLNITWQIRYSAHLNHLP